MFKKWWKNFRNRRKYPCVNRHGVRYRITSDCVMELDRKSLLESKRLWGYLEEIKRIPLNVPLDDLNRSIEEPLTEVEVDDEYLRRTGIIE